MLPEIAQAAHVLSILTLVAEALIVLLALLWLAKPKHGQALKGAEQWLARHALVLAFLVALGTTLGSLFFSNIAHFEPCNLCWWQRIFLFPQVVILALALWRRERSISVYCLWLSAIGALIAGYHYYGQMFNTSALPCQDPSNGVAACAVRQFVEFGHITIPFMSLTTFLLVGALLLVGRRYKR
jgi:disulfide bond formation protein DsbB